MFSVPLFSLIICCAEIVRQTGCLPLQHLEVLAWLGALLTLCTSFMMLVRLLCKSVLIFSLQGDTNVS
jgi:hypothetical protein